jgi:hypothetical protein
VVVMVAMVRLAGGGDGGQLRGNVVDGGEGHHGDQRQADEKGSHGERSERHGLACALFPYCSTADPLGGPYCNIL